MSARLVEVEQRWSSMRARLDSTSTRTFVMWPVVAGLSRGVVRRRLQKRYLPLLAWGYLQYRLAGGYRNRVGGGGPGMGTPPQRLVTSGIFRYTRNPMYLGHLIFLAGLALAARSPVLGAVFGWHLSWFDARAREDEERLEELFGSRYRRYRSRVPRWLSRESLAPREREDRLRRA